MKKKYTLLVLLLFITVINAQKLEKIKGSRNVIQTERVFEEVTAFEVMSDVDIFLVKSNKTKLEIYADDNLHDIVTTSLNDGKLKISLTNKIAGKKKFELTLYINNLSEITLNSSSELSSADYFEAEDLVINLNDKSKIDLLINATNLKVLGNDNAKAKLQLETDFSTFKLQDNSKIEAEIKTNILSVDAQTRAIMIIEGTANEASYLTENKASVKASNLKALKAIVDADNMSNIYVNSIDDLEINAKNKSKVYIYGSALIKIEEFINTATLFKKE